MSHTTLIQQRVARFLEMRDIPYFIATQGEIDCCCSTKAYLLEKHLKGMGLQCRHVLCFFTWESLNLPESVLQIAHEVSPSHQFLEVFIPETKQWEMVDPTWDGAIASVLPVSNWDGTSATQCAVPIQRLCTPEETSQIFKECADPVAVQEYFEKEGPFLRAVNRFLENVRADLRSAKD